MSKRTVKDLLLARHLAPAEVETLLRPYGFKEISRADANLQQIAADPSVRKLLAEFIRGLLALFSESPDPDLALNYFERYSQAVVNKAMLFSYLKDSPRTLELLVKTLWASPYMADILIRDPEYLYWVSDPKILTGERGRRPIARDLSHALKGLKSEIRRLDMIRIYKRKEMLRIGVRDLLGIADVNETVGSLTLLGEVLIQEVYETCDAAMRRKFGVPVHKGRAGRAVRTRFTILGLGKLGGGELNFSSDVDLIYLYESDDGKTRRTGVGKAARSIPNDEYFKDLSRRITSALSDMTHEGYVYRVDLRLRPEGGSGEMAYSLSGFKRYYATRGETWERMALLKTWPVGGDSKLGARFITAVRSFIYNRPFGKQAREEIRRIKERIDQKMEIRGQQNSHVKLGFGGIREIEFIVQVFQLSFGRRIPKIRNRNTLLGLAALKRFKFLGPSEMDDLSDAYRFLRDVENKLQMVHDSQVHALPQDETELRACAYRMGYKDTDQISAGKQLLEQYRLHTSRVNGIFQEVLKPGKGSPLNRSQTSR